MSPARGAWLPRACPVVLLEAGPRRRRGDGRRRRAGARGLRRLVRRRHASLHGLRAARHAVAGDAGARRWSFRRRCAGSASRAMLARQDLLTIAARLPTRTRRCCAASTTPVAPPGWSTAGLTAASRAPRRGVEAPGAIKTERHRARSLSRCLGLIAAAVKRRARRCSNGRRSPASVPAGTRSRSPPTAGRVSGRPWSSSPAHAPIADLRPLRRHLQSAPRLWRRHGAAGRAASGGRSDARTTALRARGRRSAAVRALAAVKTAFWSAGADQPPVPAQSRDQAIVQRTGQLMYELSLIYPAISGTRAGMGVVASVRRHGGRSALHRRAPQFSAPPVRARPGPARRGRLVARRPDPAAPHPRRSRRKATISSVSRRILH